MSALKIRLYVFLRPTILEIVERYKQKFGGSACASGSSSAVAPPLLSHLSRPLLSHHKFKRLFRIKMLSF